MSSTGWNTSSYNLLGEKCCNGIPSAIGNRGVFSYKRRNQPVKSDTKNNRNNNNEPKAAVGDVASVDILAQTTKDLNEMTFVDREQMFEEMNGVPSLIEEDPDFVNTCLDSLTIQMELLTTNTRCDTSAYDLAMELRPDLSKDRAFRLLFLRADNFDVPKAAKRMVLYFQSKRLLFGPHKFLVQPQRITYEDLDEDAKWYLVNGPYQILPSRDQTGRAILFVWTRQREPRDASWKTQLQIVWYLTMSILESDENVQKRGIVLIDYSVGTRWLGPQCIDFFNHIRTLDAIPLRIVGVHFCYNVPQLRPIALFIQNALNRDFRLRFQTHYGTDMECQYGLMRYGIAPDILPVDSRGHLRKSLLQCPIAQQNSKEQQQQSQEKLQQNQGADNTRHQESSASSKLRIIRDADIQLNDVLLGKGKCHFHTGNQQLMEWIHAHQEMYLAASKFEKTCIAMMIVDKVKNCQGRFLERFHDCGGGDDRVVAGGTVACGNWKEVSDVRARRLVVLRFRHKMV